MTIPTLSDNNFGTEEVSPLIENTVDGFVDYKGRPVHPSSSGGWRSASFILAVELAERFSYYGISSNLITYLTGPLGQSTASAAENVNTWSGTASLLPILGALVADLFLGRYRTIIFASLIYVLGLGLLTLSAILNVSNCDNSKNIASCSSTKVQVILFFFSLYLVAVGQGGHKPCVQAFGADQFDGQDPEESKAKSSFFNWWYFCISAGVLLTLIILVYIQDNLNWALGFGIPCIAIVVALLIFMLGSRTYRYSIRTDEKNALARIGRVLVRSFRNWSANPSGISSEAEAYHYYQSSKQFKFLNKAILAPDGSIEDHSKCSINDIEETKSILRFVPIWATSLIYAIVFAQTTTFFTKQGATMDRKVLAGFEIPAASLQTFIGIAIILLIPIYDRIFVPVARALTGRPTGITMLQRIGTGMFLSIISMVAAALVEMKRLETAKEYGLIDKPNATVPMSVWWLIPQYVLCGAADVFTIVGLQEFFYDQVPKDLRSVGLSLYLSVIGVGSFLSSFIVSIIDKATKRGNQEGWFANNLNEGHLDYFYWLLAGLSALGLIAYLYFAKSYNYGRRTIYSS